MQILLKSEQISEVVEKCSKWIKDILGQGKDVAVIGVKSRGDILAKRVVDAIESSYDGQICFGSLDITLYRDDVYDHQPDQQPVLRSTEIDFDITDKTIILVDDVLSTGRSVRAAMDALIEFGRPSAIKLAVLVDRGGREYPIQPDFFGAKVDVDNSKRIEVSFVETNDIDRVAID